MSNLKMLLLPGSCLPVKRWASLVAALLLVCLPATAEQLIFNKIKQPTGFEFNYQWLDSFGQIQNLEFILPINQQGQRTHKRFVENLAQQYVYIELLKAARKIDPREARITINRRTQNNIEIEVTSRSEQMLKKWQQAMRQINTYLIIITVVLPPTSVRKRSNPIIYGISQKTKSLCCP